MIISMLLKTFFCYFNTYFCDNIFIILYLVIVKLQYILKNVILRLYITNRLAHSN